MAVGGIAKGSDTVPAMLTPGEFVINKQASKAFLPLLSLINDTKYPSMLSKKLASPAFSSNYGRRKVKDFASPVFYTPSNTMINANPISGAYSASNVDNSSMVYNYNIGINVGGTNASANNIAQTVIDEIKYIDSQRVRTQRAV